MRFQCPYTKLQYFEIPNLSESEPKRESTEDPRLTRILGLEIRVSGTVMGPLQTQKIPHLHIHKPKTVVVETVLVILCKWETPCMLKSSKDPYLPNLRRIEL